VLHGGYSKVLACAAITMLTNQNTACVVLRINEDRV